MRRGICIFRARESGATASGGDTMAPSTNPSGHDRRKIQWAAAAVASVVNATQPTANREMGRKLKRNSRQSMAIAEE